MKGYLAGELLCSLVSQDLHTSGRHTSTALGDWRYSVKNQSGAILYIYLSTALHKRLVLIRLKCVSVLCFVGGSQSNVTRRNANYVV